MKANESCVVVGRPPNPQGIVEKGIQLTIEDAIARRDEGIQRAGEHAGDRWKHLARGYLLEYIAGSAGQFLAEDVRAFAELRGFTRPPDGRAWGAVIQSAARDGVIVKAGYAPARSSNMAPKCAWRAK